MEIKKTTRYVRTREFGIKEITHTKYGHSYEIGKQEVTFVHNSTRFYSKPSKYDIIEVLTKKTNPELYL